MGWLTSDNWDEVVGQMIARGMFLDIDKVTALAREVQPYKERGDGQPREECTLCGLAGFMPLVIDHRYEDGAPAKALWRPGDIPRGKLSTSTVECICKGSPTRFQQAVAAMLGDLLKRPYLNSAIDLYRFVHRVVEVGEATAAGECEMDACVVKAGGEGAGR